MKTLVEEIDVLRKDNEFLTIENRMLKEQLAFEQRKNQRDANRRG
jgi:regulator of replication initiation timing